MKRKGAQDVPAGAEVTSAANEEFSAVTVTATNPLNGHAEPRPAWDPYEVWRTRVKTAARPSPKHEPDTHWAAHEADGPLAPASPPARS